MRAIVWYICYMYGTKPLDPKHAPVYLNHMAHPRLIPPLTVDQANTVTHRAVRLWLADRDRKPWFDYVRQALTDLGHDPKTLRMP